MKKLLKLYKKIKNNYKKFINFILLSNLMSYKSNNEMQKKNTTNPTIIITNNSDATSIYGIFHSILSIIAIYLSVRCNQKINYTSIVIAIFFPYLYIIYSIIVHNGLCPA